jgi:hypothetical protein
LSSWDSCCSLATFGIGWGLPWTLPIVAVVGLIVALALDVDPIHDIGLFVFEGAWVALGIALIRRRGTAVVRF